MDKAMIYTKRHLLFLTLIAWLAMVGFDFLIHAGILARLYQQPGPFLRTPLAALTLIPVGYLAMLLLCVLLVWLMVRLNLRGMRQGALFGVELGGLMVGAFLLGLGSISTASSFLLVGWFIGQSLEMSLAGAVIGSGLAGTRLRRLFGFVLIFVVVSIVLTIVLQSLGIAPTTRLP